MFLGAVKHLFEPLRKVLRQLVLAKSSGSRTNAVSCFDVVLVRHGGQLIIKLLTKRLFEVTSLPKVMSTNMTSAQTPSAAHCNRACLRCIAQVLPHGLSWCGVHLQPVWARVFGPSVRFQTGEPYQSCVCQLLLCSSEANVTNLCIAIT